MDRRATGRRRRPGPRRPRPAIPRRLAAAVAAACLCAAPAAAAADATLDFAAPVPDTILDAAGRGTGFTRVIADGGLEPGGLELATAPGLLLVTSTSGDAARAGPGGSDQDNALSVRVAAAGPYAVEASLVGPLALSAPGQAAGIYVGTGQGAYARASVAFHAPEEGEPGLRLAVASEGAEAGRAWGRGVSGLGDAIAVVLRLEIDPATGAVRATARLDGGEEEPIDPSGEPVVLAELAGPARPDLTAGIITTHGDSGVPFTVAFDRFAIDAPPEVRISLGTTFRDGAPRTQVIAAFSDPMDAASVRGALALLDPAGLPVPGTITVGEDRRTAVLDPLSALAPDASYTALVAATATDETGNPLAGPARLVITPALRARAESPRPVGPGPAPSGPGGAPLCAAVPEPVSRAAAGRVELSARQLLVNQRIAQAAVRRANAIQAWLDAGVATDDLCGGGLGPDVLGPGIVTGGTAHGVAPSPARPRALAPAAPARGGRRAPVRLSVRQLLVGQRIAQAALRRVEALADRLDAGLTGGDLRDGAVTAAKLTPGLGLLTARTVADPPAATRTAPTAPLRRGGGRVELTAAQLRINQRIARAAVRRANEIARRLRRGLTGADFRPGSITAIALETALRRP